MRTVILAGLIAFSTAPLIAQDNAALADPVMVSLTTGSTLATWTVDAKTPTHNTPVVFLHGGPGMFTSAKQFEHGQVFRDAGFNTLYFDQAGGGFSPRIPASQYTIARAVADLEAFRLAKGADKLVLWGSSYGADLAILYAQKYPQQVAAFVLTSPGAFPGTSHSHDYSKTARGKVTMNKEIIKAANLIDKKGGAAEAIVSQDTAGKLMDELIKAEFEGAGQCKGVPPRAVMTQGGSNLFANRMIQTEMKKMPQPVPAANAPPTLIVRGECDYVSEKSVEKFRAFFGGEYVVVPGAGHGLSENRNIVDDAIAKFAKGALADVP